MYRLPNQFDPVARNGSIAAAGGGSTSTTCSSCVVTLLASCITPAVLFSNSPTPLPGLKGAKVIESIHDGHGAEPVLAPTRPEPELVEPISSNMQVALGFLGFFLFPLGLALFALIAFSGLGVGVAGVVSLAAVLTVFALVYNKTRGRPRTGLIIGVVFIAAALAAGALEVIIWLKAR